MEVKMSDVKVPPELAGQMLELVDGYRDAKDKELEAKATKTILSARLRDLLLLIDLELPEFGARVLVNGANVATIKHSPRGVIPTRAKAWAEDHPDDAEQFMVTEPVLDTRALLETQIPDDYDLLKRIGYYFG